MSSYEVRSPNGADEGRPLDVAAFKTANLARWHRWKSGGTNPSQRRPPAKDRQPTLADFSVWDVSEVWGVFPEDLGEIGLVGLVTGFFNSKKSDLCRVGFRHWLKACSKISSRGAQRSRLRALSSVDWLVFRRPHGPGRRIIGARSVHLLGAELRGGIARKDRVYRRDPHVLRLDVQLDRRDDFILFEDLRRRRRVVGQR